MKKMESNGLLEHLSVDPEPEGNDATSTATTTKRCSSSATESAEKSLKKARIAGPTLTTQALQAAGAENHDSIVVPMTERLIELGKIIFGEQYGLEVVPGIRLRRELRRWHLQLKIV
jgi:hypothetical protein